MYLATLFIQSFLEPTLHERGIMPLLWTLQYFYELLVILLQERSVLSPTTYSVISLYQHGHKDILYFGSHTLVLLYCVLPIALYLVISSSFKKLLSPCGITP